MRRLRIDLNFYLQIWIECPPLSNPIWLIAFSLSSNSRTVRLGMSTPAMLSSDLSKRMVDLFTASTTFPLNNFSSNTGILLQRTSPQRLKSRLPCIPYPSLFCFREDPSLFPWISSSKHQLFSLTTRGPSFRLQFFVWRAACSCVRVSVHSAGGDLSTHGS